MLTLEEWIRQDPQTGFYVSGQRLLQLTVNMRGQDPVLDIVGPVLQELAQRTGHSACLAIGQGYHFMIVAKSERPRSYQFIDTMTPNLDWIDNSMGQFLLAFRPTEMVESIYSHYFRQHVPVEHLTAFEGIRQRRFLIGEDKFVTRIIAAVEPENDQPVDSLVALAALDPVDAVLPALLQQVKDAAAIIQTKLKNAHLSITQHKPPS
jgi:DNA-binding IclR family transcriptional regulator